MSLDLEELEQEQNETKDLQGQLENTTKLVKYLSEQLRDLRDKVSGKKRVELIEEGTLKVNLNLSFFSLKMNEQRKMMQRKHLHSTIPALQRFTSVAY